MKPYKRLCLLLTVAGATWAQTPILHSGGIVNAASQLPSTLAGGALAQGCIFSIKGSNLGPGDPNNAATGVQAGSLPLQTSLGGSSVRVTAGSQTLDAFVLFAWANQINAVLPSNTPVGEIEVRVTYQGRTSAPAKTRVVRSAFGMFTVPSTGAGPAIVQNFVDAARTPLNTHAATARPGQPVILWGTGLGPVLQGADNVRPSAGDLPVTLQILVGGRPATVIRYRGRSPEFPGLDQIVFDVPNDAPQGCYVPLQLRAGEVWSNTATLAIQARGERCADAFNPLSPVNVSNVKSGFISLVRLSGLFAVGGTEPVTLNLDLGLGEFAETPAIPDLNYNPVTSLPPPGSCMAFAGDDTFDLLGDDSLDVDLGRGLDAGRAITISGAGGTRELEQDPEAKGSYFGVIGGSLPLPGFPQNPLFLNPGSFTVSGRGGADVGPFSTTFTLPAPLTWTNRDQLTTVNRAAGLTLNWTGSRQDQTVLIVGTANDSANEVSGTFLCLTPGSQSSFTVPASTLAILPESRSEDDLGLIGLTLLPSRETGTFRASGLDEPGTIVGLSVTGRTVQVR